MNIKKIIVIIYAVFLLAMFSSCGNKEETDQEKIAYIVQERYSDIYNFNFDRSMSLEDAECYLYCWADENSGVEISEEELREAIWVVLESNEDIRELIYDIDEIDIDY
jgi:hypothetical protein